MSVLVTGANGLIGSNIVRALVAGGAEVRALVRPGSDLGSLRGLPVGLVHGEVTADDEIVTRAAAGAEVIFHTAVRFAYAGPGTREIERDAIAGTERVLAAARRVGARRVVVTSSSVVFGYEPTPSVRDESSGYADAANESAYVAAKVRQDQRALEVAGALGVDLVLVCPTMSVGGPVSRLGPSNAIVVAYLNDPLRCTFPGGCNIVSVADVADGHLLAARLGRPGEHYLVGSENLEWHEIHGMIAELCGVPAPRVRLNRTLSYLASTTEEIRARFERRTALATADQATMVGRFYWYSHVKAAALGFHPRPARTALAEAISGLAKSPHVSRRVRSTLRLHPEVYRARRALSDAGSRIVAAGGGAS